MNEYDENNELLEEEEGLSSAPTYEEIMAAKKLTMDDIKEHFTGPVISVLLHVVLLVFLSTWIVFRAPDKGKDIQVQEVVVEPQEIEEIVPPEEPEEVVEETDIDVEVERPDVESDDSNVEVDEVAVDAPAQDVVMPNILSVKPTNSALVMPALYGARSGNNRKGALKRYGGGRRTEKSLLSGLRWLKDHQNSDGSWGDSAQNNFPAYTGMALLAFLAHGETPSSAEFGQTVMKAIKKLVEYVGYDGMGVPGGYRHAIATYALCEAYGLTQIPDLEDIMNKCVQRIVNGMNKDGSFNYLYENGDFKQVWDNQTVSGRCDLSVGGWNYQALKAAYADGSTANGLEEVIDRGINVGLKKTHFAGSGFSYNKKGGASEVITAVGTLCLQLYGEGSSQEAQAGLATLEDQSNFWIAWKGKDGKIIPWSLYKWYYQTQAIFQGHKGTGGKWKKWNKMFTRELIRRQKEDGRWESPAFEGKVGGHSENTELHGLDQPVYSTSLCCLMLEVYYRYLPTFNLKHMKHVKSAAGGSEGSDDEDVDVKIE